MRVKAEIISAFISVTIILLVGILCLYGFFDHKDSKPITIKQTLQRER